MTWSAYSRRSFSGSAPATHLTANAASGDTTISIASTAGWPTITTPSTGFVVVVDGGSAAEEAMFVTAWVANSSATVTRGFDGTTAVAHTSPATVQLCDSAVDMDESNQIVHALAGSAPTTGQVLTADTTLTPPVKWATNPSGIPLSTVTTAGDLIAGTGSGSVERLPKGSAGQVLTVGGVDVSGLEWATPATVALSSDSGFLSAGTAALASGAFTTIQTTNSLAVGTWLVRGSYIATTSRTGGDTIDLEVAAGTATASFNGPRATSMFMDQNGQYSVTVECLVVITVAGTLTFRAQPQNNAVDFINAATVVTSTAQASGYTAVKIA